MECLWVWIGLMSTAVLSTGLLRARETKCKLNCAKKRQMSLSFIINWCKNLTDYLNATSGPGVTT